MQMPLQLEESNWKSIDFQIDYLNVCQNEDSKLSAGGGWAINSEFLDYNWSNVPAD